MYMYSQVNCNVRSLIASYLTPLVMSSGVGEWKLPPDMCSVHTCAIHMYMYTVMLEDS